MAPDPILQVEDLQVSYGGIIAVHGVTLAVERGTIVAFIGPNGAGKSSTVRAIGGRERSRGRVLFDGNDISGKPPHRIARLGFGQVPQGRRIFPQLTVSENLALGAYGRKDREGKRQATVFELFPRLAERRSQKAGSMSGGEQQMLAIGRALMGNPTLLAMDEPSLGLAPKVVDEVFRNVQHIRDLGVSIILVEQRAMHALSISDYVYVFERGRLAYEGNAEVAEKELDLIRTYVG